MTTEEYLALEAKLEKARVALSFYADEANYNMEGAPTLDQKAQGYFGTDYDSGDIARKALEEIG